MNFGVLNTDVGAKGRYSRQEVRLSEKFFQESERRYWQRFDLFPVTKRLERLR